MSYPIIEVPTSVYFIAESGKSIDKPTKPKVNYKEPELIQNNEGCVTILAHGVLFIAGTIFLIALFALFMEGESLNKNSGFFMPLIISIIVAFIIKKNYSKKEAYDKATDFYLTKKTEYEEKIKTYEAELADYQEKIEAKNRIGKDAFIRNSLFEYYENFNHPPSKIVKEGKTEQTFYKLLIEYFGNLIQKNAGIIKKNILGITHHMSPILLITMK